MRFSQRKEITPIRVEIQKESIDAPLRNKIWSAVVLCFFDAVDKPIIKSSNFEMAIKFLWLYFFKLPLDKLPDMWRYVNDTLREWFFGYEWYEVYDFIEALAKALEGTRKEQFITLVNSFLESEMSAYRFVGDEIGEFTNATEIHAIEGAIANTQELQTVHIHLREALAKLTDRASPDYRNSIKESISAIEAMCQLIVGNKKTTLGDAIKKLKSVGISLHPAIEKAWSNLYGFTSDEGGIRHALSDSPDITFGAAKYMLVSCSAFVNYLLDLSREAGIPIGTP